MGVAVPRRFAINSRVSRLRPSGIRVIADLAAQRVRDGVPVYPFHLGEPDFDTPHAIKLAAADALMRGEVHYPPTAGIPALRSAIADDLVRRYGRSTDSQNVVVTVGACEALTLALWSCLDGGQEVVVPTPCWPNYLQTPELVGATVKTVPLDPYDGYAFDVQRVIDATGPNTGAILINSPNNPTGVAIPGRDLERLLEHCRGEGIWLVVDEIYHDIVYDPAWTSVLQVADTDDPVVYVNGFSKSYAMTGWRLGYVAGPATLAQHMTHLHQALVTSVTSFVQYGALAALETGADDVAAMRSTYAARRARVLAALEASGITVTAPDGAFYVFPDVPSGWADGDAFARDVLTQHGVAVVPGSVFGAAHAGAFRLCFACDDELLDRGLAALGRAVAAGPNDRQNR